MLSFLHRWDYCWKCEFDIDVILVKIENYNHHDRQQLLFYKKVHIKTQSKMKDVLVIFILLLEMKNSKFFFDKNCTQENIKCHNWTWRKLTWMNCNWTGKLQVTLLSAYISRKKLCSLTLKAPSEEVILTYSAKMKAKYIKEDVWKSFFIQLQVNISQLHNRLTSPQTDYSNFK